MWSRMNWRPLLVCCVLAVPLAAVALALDAGTEVLETMPEAQYVAEPVVTIPADPPAISVAATVGEAAFPDRGIMIQVAETVPPPPPPSARQVCNSLTYVAYDPGPSGTCFRAITQERGWGGKTDLWFPFIVSEFSGVIQGESGHCWNVRRNEIIEAGEVCNEANKTRIGPLGDDVGFGQATSVWHGRNGWLCREHGYCGVNSILASPYDSMLATIVLLVEYQGSAPWCYSSHARSYHQCWEAPDR